MKAIAQFIVFSAFIGFLLIFPFISMEIVNRREFGEDFPFVLFFGMWQILLAINLILLPTVRASGQESMTSETLIKNLEARSSQIPS